MLKAKLETRHQVRVLALKPDASDPKFEEGKQYRVAFRRSSDGKYLSDTTEKFRSEVTILQMTPEIEEGIAYFPISKACADNLVPNNYGVELFTGSEKLRYPIRLTITQADITSMLRALEAKAAAPVAPAAAPAPAEPPAAMSAAPAAASAAPAASSAQTLPPTAPQAAPQTAATQPQSQGISKTAIIAAAAAVVVVGAIAAGAMLFSGGKGETKPAQETSAQQEETTAQAE